MTSIQSGQQALEEQLRLVKGELDKKFKRELSEALDAQAADQDRTMQRLEASLDKLKSMVEMHESERKSLREQHVHVDMLETIRAETLENGRAVAREVMADTHATLQRH